MQIQYNLFEKFESIPSFHICSTLCFVGGWGGDESGWVEDKRVIVETTCKEKHLFCHNYHLPHPFISSSVLPDVAQLQVA
jgi:hypothetical protein